MNKIELKKTLPEQIRVARKGEVIAFLNSENGKLTIKDENGNIEEVGTDANNANDPLIFEANIIQEDIFVPNLKVKKNTLNQTPYCIRNGKGDYSLVGSNNIFNGNNIILIADPDLKAYRKDNNTINFGSGNENSTININNLSLIVKVYN